MKHQKDLIGTRLQIVSNGKAVFNLDTILLADFVQIKHHTQHIVDFGTGNGALLLYLSQKTQAHLTGIEIQQIKVDEANQNIILNQLSDQISMRHEDLTQTKIHPRVDVIISNPPFFKINEQTKRSMDPSAKIARHEVYVTLKTLIEAAGRNLKQGGRFFMIHRPDRFDEILSLMEENKFKIKRIRFVHPFKGKNANHVLIEARYQAKAQLTVESPLILYDDKHIMTSELKDIYGGRSYATIHAQ